jgi:hypothetical protein
MIAGKTGLSFQDGGQDTPGSVHRIHLVYLMTYPANRFSGRLSSKQRVKAT